MHVLVSRHQDVPTALAYAEQAIQLGAHEVTAVKVASDCWQVTIKVERS